MAPGTSRDFLSLRTALSERILAKPAQGGKLKVDEYHARLGAVAADMAADAEAGQQLVTVDLATSRSSRFSKR